MKAHFFKTWIFWIGLGLAIAMLGQLFEWYTISLIGFIILLSITSVFIIAAFVVNPINGFCNKPEKTIKKGFHRRLFSIPFCLPRIVNTYKKMTYMIDLTKTRTSSLNHTNKLFGFTVGWFVHKDSFRTVYSEINKELFAYYYIDGKRTVENFKLNNNGEGFTIATIERRKEGIIFTADHNDSVKKIVVPFTSKSKYGLKLGFYYGGEETAPHNINVIINKVK